MVRPESVFWGKGNFHERGSAPALGRFLPLAGRDLSDLELYALQPMAFDGIGPSQACLNICEAAGRLGARVSIYATRRRVDPPGHCALYAPYHNLGAALPYRASVSILERRADRQIRRDVPDGAIVYAWPSLRPATLLEMKRRGCFIAIEMINIPTLVEKRIIEREMAEEGISYPHYVTDKKVAAQIQTLAIADLIFASNPHSVEALRTLGVPKSRIVLTRYAATQHHERTRYDSDRPVFAFVGRVNMEKGVHHLLRAWREADVAAELRLYGRVDPQFEAHFGDLLNQRNVRLMGFHRDISACYRSADAFIFLSLAEGGPLATIEAAAHGLPMILSPMGAGRLAQMGEEVALIHPPRATSEIAASIRALAADADLRRRYGQAAFAAAAEFSWSRAAEERLAAIIAARSRPAARHA